MLVCAKLQREITNCMPVYFIVEPTGGEERLRDPFGVRPSRRPGVRPSRRPGVRP